MKIFDAITQWRLFRKQDLFNHKTIGLVPTMGSLHAGHKSLLARSVQDNDFTVLYIFINPTQFDDADDYDNYPRTLTEDIAIAEDCGVDFLLALTDSQTLYPDNFHYRVTETELSQRMEGQYRPGHFDGVLTIVLKFLQLIKPTRAYFGEKDFQQLRLVKGMVDAFFMDTEIIACATVRTEQGLALSSRNRRLSDRQLAQAQLFPQLLHSDLSTQEITLALQHKGFKVDYIEEYQGRRFGAVRLGTVRLIDNIALDRLK